MNDFLLYRSPLAPIAIIGLYLLFVLKLGPNLMKSRQPYALKRTIIVYNVSQIALNVFFFYKIVQLTFRTTVACVPVDESHLKMLPEVLYLHHAFLLLKIYDFSDTIFFVLRKKQRQISFLHLFHHVAIFLYVWVCGKYFPASDVLPPGPGIILGGLNSLVHVFMYIYYLLTSLDVAVGIRWKKYLTLLQLAQHVTLFLLNCHGIQNPECPYPKGVVFCSVLFSLSQNYLFGSFYYEAYVKKNNTNKNK